MENKNLREFLVGMIKEKRLSVSSDEVMEQLIADMSQRLMDLIDRDVLNAMSESNVDKLNTMLDEEASDTEVQQFIAESVPDLDQVTARTMTRFRNAYLANGQ
jgi:hypothetical protein